MGCRSRTAVSTSTPTSARRRCSRCRRSSPCASPNATSACAELAAAQSNFAPAATYARSAFTSSAVGCRLSFGGMWSHQWSSGSSHSFTSGLSPGLPATTTWPFSLPFLMPSIVVEHEPGLALLGVVVTAAVVLQHGGGRARRTRSSRRRRRSAWARVRLEVRTG